MATKGSSWRQNPNSIMKGYGSWSDLTITRADGKKFKIPADIVRQEERTRKIVKAINNHDIDTEKEYAVV